MKIVSIVTTTYKKFENLKKTIDSVLKQDYSFIEYIIADDGSRDFPLDEIKEYVIKNKKNNIVKFWIIDRKQNIGTVRNLKDAYMKSIGEILIPLSCGDIFVSKDTVSKIVQYFIEKKCSALATSRIVVDKNEIPKFFYPHIGRRANVKKLFSNNIAYGAFVSGYYYNMVSGSALYIKKDYFESVGGFDEIFYLWEDGPFIEKSLRDNKLVVEPFLVTIKYRLGGISNFKTTNELMLKDVELYNKNYRLSYISKLNYKYKILAKYTVERASVNKSIDILIVYIKYFLCVLYRLAYKVKEKIGEWMDARYIKKQGGLYDKQ